MRREAFVANVTRVGPPVEVLAVLMVGEVDGPGEGLATQLTSKGQSVRVHVFGMLVVGGLAGKFTLADWTFPGLTPVFFKFVLHVVTLATLVTLIGRFHAVYPA